MKKLMKVSLVAMLVAAPMVASAAIAPVNYTDGQATTKPTVTANTNVATTSYVQGAYNELAEAINTVNSNALTLSTAETGTYTNTGSGLTSATIGAAITELGTSKQDTLSEAQLAAANSGITAAKVSTYDGYATDIAGKQDTLSEAQLAAANSGIDSTKVAQITTNANDIAAIKAQTLPVYGTWNSGNSTGSVTLFPAN